MVQNKFHKNFQFNSISFSSSDDLLAYTKVFSEEIHHFLENWFSKSNVIIVQTSGSTGTPKSISLQKKFVINSAKATGAFFDLQENTTALLCLPIQYIAGKLMLIRALTLGWKLDSIESNSNPLKKVEKQYDFSAMVPLQLENSLSKIHLIKKLIVGGGVVSISLQEKLQTVSTDVFATYGMTETITHIAVKKLNHFASLHGKMMIQSYYQTLPNITIYKDDRNCLVIDAPKVAEEIVFTNDVVELISDRHFKWIGRFDHVINSGGVKLHPEKIEEKLAKIISNRFFVIGIPDEKLGEKLILLIEGNQKEISFESSNLTKFEIPKEIYFLDQFVETASGKIQRKKTFEKFFTQ
ncbi:AMP-binding protein [Polaribacter litorisediminis]|uniref:AMP-binding protein n=1 Tax=Polaribacter litorisediminis TaxID=1908341 RepID=UPI001CC03870|nr:AMP-binding protein [Polaribacter litorisediminis]UAM99322.1 AMP-binding protein [Polaribacter litorisediminis]